MSVLGTVAVVSLGVFAALGAPLLSGRFANRIALAPSWVGTAYAIAIFVAGETAYLTAIAALGGL